MDQNDIERLISQASAAVSQHRDSSPRVGTPLPAAVRDFALQLLAAGVSANFIASRIGVSRGAIAKWAHPVATASKSNESERTKREVIVYPLKAPQGEDCLKLKISFSVWKWLTCHISMGENTEDAS